MKMRVSKEAKAEGLGEKAAQALQEGRTIFTCELAPVHPLTQSIEAVEAVGWHLEHASAYWNTAGMNNRHVVLIFRRVGDAPTG